jgi:hypothetical protein
MVLGALIGEWIYRIVEHPTKNGVKRLVLVGLSMPSLTGVVDLLLRWMTP